jgi:hypothetical protein
MALHCWLLPVAVSVTQPTSRQLIQLMRLLKRGVGPSVVVKSKERLWWS